MVARTKKVVTTTQVFVAEDGKEFNTQKECEEYEKTLHKSANEMIFDALCTGSKKRKVKYQAELEAMGFKVSKDGGWFVENPTTGIYIKKYYDEPYIYLSKQGKRIFIGDYYISRKGTRRNHTTPDKINFIGILNALPTYVEDNGYAYFCGTYNDKYIYGYKNKNVSFMMYQLEERRHSKRILEKADTKLQDELEKARLEYERKVANIKESNSLDIQWATDRLNDSATKIAELLNK